MRACAAARVTSVWYLPTATVHAPELQCRSASTPAPDSDVAAPADDTDVVDRRRVLYERALDSLAKKSGRR